MKRDVVVAVVDDLDHVRDLVAQSLRDAGIDVAVLSPSLLDLTGEQCTVAVVTMRVSDGSVTQAAVQALVRAGVDVLGVTHGDDADLMRFAVESGMCGVLRRGHADDAVGAVRAVAHDNDWVSPEWAAAIDTCAFACGVALDMHDELLLSALAGGESIAASAARLGDTPAGVEHRVREIRERVLTGIADNSEGSSTWQPTK